MRALQLGPSNLESKSYSASGLCNLRLIVKAIWLRYKAWSGARFSFRLCSWLNASVVLAANGTQAGMRASAFASILDKAPDCLRPLKTCWVAPEDLLYKLYFGCSRFTSFAGVFTSSRARKLNERKCGSNRYRCARASGAVRLQYCVEALRKAPLLWCLAIIAWRQAKACRLHIGSAWPRSFHGQVDRPRVS